jgi:antitoxin HigA-1
VYFGNSPGFWLGLQNDFDIEEERHSKKAELSGIRPLVIDAAD